MEPVPVAVWSDVACPWCLLGHAHLQAASEQASIPVDVTFHSYQLSPEMTGSQPANAYVEAKYGDPVRVQGMRDRLVAMGAEAGVSFDFDSAIASNTFDAHRLHQYAGTQGLGNDVMHQLLTAMHEQGKDMADHAILQSIGESVGLLPDAVQQLLAGDDFADVVHADIAAARQMGVTGVPFFVLGGKYSLSGAQPTDVFVQALQAAVSAVDQS